MKRFSVTECYGTDHDRLDGLFRDFQALKGKDREAARASFLQFRSGLERHILWEEEILFPFFEAKTGLSENGPTSVMRHEHQMILADLAALGVKLAAGDPETRAEEESLLSRLHVHNVKEEQILYPAIDSQASPSEGDEIRRRMEALPGRVGA